MIEEGATIGVNELGTQGGAGADTVYLAHRQDFRLGRALVRPSIRTVQTPAGEATAEPRVMQVLLALADAQGAVLSRDDLLRICWGGRIVGDDAINRAVAEARRLSQAIGAGFTIETVPRIGYRLTVEPGAHNVQVLQPVGRPGGHSRRNALWLGTAGVAALALGGLGFSAWKRKSRVEALIAQGKQMQVRGTGDRPYQDSAEFFRRALRDDPDRADAWGALAVALTAGASSAAPSQRAAMLDEGQHAAQRALALDPRTPDARAALALLRRGLDDWIVFERELRAVLADFPDHYFSLICLVWFFQGVGRCRESWDLNERALAIEPLSPTCQFRRGMKHWIMGRPAEAERVSARALEVWPDEPNVWNSRLTILAFTGRPEAALAMLDDVTNRPKLGAAAIAVWRTGLIALASGAVADRTRLRETALASFEEAPGVAANAIMLLSATGQIDAAFRVTEGILLSLGPQRVRSAKAGNFYTDAGWRGTQWLFTPATAALRNDQRFSGLCDRIGYLAYWRRRGIWPDPFLRGSLPPR